MLILSQTNELDGFHGRVGIPTNMYDYTGNQLFVGDIVGITTAGEDGRKSYDYGIDFVCEEIGSIVNWTGKDYQFVMGLSSAYNNNNFKNLETIDKESNEDLWYEELEKIDPDFRVYKVKDFHDLVIGEKINFLKVVEINDSMILY